MSVAAGALWPLQAAALSWTVSGWVEGNGSPMMRATLTAVVFLIAAALRAGLEQRAGAVLFQAADQVITGERDRLINQALQAPPAGGSAGFAALAVQKLPLLHPWITRYHVAMIRVRVLPLLLLALALSQSWAVALILLVAGPLIPVFMALVGMAAESASKRQLQELGDMNDLLMDHLSALLDLRLLGATPRANRLFATRAEAVRQRTMEVLRIAFLSSTVLELFAALGVALVAVLVGFTLLGELSWGGWGGPIGLGQGLFLLLIAPKFFQPLRDLAAAWHDRAAGLAVMAELDSLHQAPRRPVLGTGAPAQALPGPLQLRIHGACVTRGARQITLPDLTVRPGQSLALTGASGAGKSTMLAALAGLAPLDAGQITVKGHPLTQDTADAWRAGLGWMPQQPHFADQPLSDWLDLRGTGADPWPALRLARADQVVRRLPQGLNTRLGETGGGVSGGEARRLLLARAALAGPELILADEPTADLDPETAGQIITALQDLHKKGRAVIVATHDPALARALQHQIELPS